MKRKAFGVIGAILVVFLSFYVGVGFVFADDVRWNHPEAKKNLINQYQNQEEQNQEEQIQDDGFLSDFFVFVLFPPKYDKADIWLVNHFILDAVEFDGFDLDVVVAGGLKGFLRFNWKVYLYFALFIIFLVSEAYELDLIDQVSGILQTSLDEIYTDIFKPFLYFMYCVAIAWMVYYWIVGKTTRMWQTVFSTLLIIALSATIFTNLPSFLKQVNQVSSTISNLILDGLLYNSGNDQKSSSDQLKFVSVNTDSAIQLAKPVEDAGGGAELSPQRKLEGKLSYLFILKAYKIANFGSEKLADETKVTKDGKKVMAWEGFLNTGTDMEERKRMADEVKEEVPFFTAEGQYDRMFAVILVTICFGFNLICLLIIAVLVIFWQLIAIGRALMAACYLTIALWPDYGLKEAIQWGWSMVHALFMKVFYTIILSVYVKFTMALIEQATTPQNGEKMGYMTACLIGIGTFYGLWMALKELREKLSNIPLDGINLVGDKGQAEEMLKTTAGVTAAGVAAAAGAVGAAAAATAGAAVGSGALLTGNKFLGDLATKGVKGTIKGKIADRVANKQQKRAEKEQYHDFLQDEHLSAGARSTFEQMKAKGYDPTNLDDINKYEEKNAGSLEGLDEIKRVAYMERMVAQDLGKKRNDPAVKKETMRRLKEEKEAQRKIEEQKRKIEEEKKKKNRQIQIIREQQETRKIVTNIQEMLNNIRSLHNPHNDRNE